MQEKAIEALKRALQLGHKNHVYNEWSRRSAGLLAKLSPELFPVVDDAVVNSEWPVAATFSTTYISDPAGKLEQMIEPAKGTAAKKKKAQKKSGKKGEGKKAKAKGKKAKGKKAKGKKKSKKRSK